MMDGGMIGIDELVHRVVGNRNAYIKTFTFPLVPPVMQGIFDDGGPVAYIKKHGDLVVG